MEQLTSSLPRLCRVQRVVRSRYHALNSDGGIVDRGSSPSAPHSSSSEISGVEIKYNSGDRPLSWDKRISGVDVIATANGEELKLFSDGGQSTPKPGWNILLTSGSPTEGYSWTLYGI